MAFYESVFIIRQDASSADVDKIIEDFSRIVQTNGGKVLKTEYWGMRSLAYEIANNKRGHYVLLGLEASHSIIQEIERRMKLSENVIRFCTQRVDAISSEYSPILKSKVSENVEAVNVTS